MEEIDIPEYFICPVSLQIMKDPVTAVTGITYDRESIQRWLLTADDATCPVTKQPLPRDFDLTPNHTLRRLIQAWCTADINHGKDRIQAPKSPLSISHVLKLHRQLKIPQLYLNSLRALGVLANENETNIQCLAALAESGTAKEMILLIIRCFKEDQIVGVEEAFKVLHLTWKPSPENILLVKENFELIEAILWSLESEVDNTVVFKTSVMLVLKMIIEFTSSSLVERLKDKFFKEIVNVMRKNISDQATKSALNVLTDVCPLGRSRMKIVEAGAIFELVELEFGSPGKKLTELIFCLLANLCSCADGRAQLLKHSGGIAMVAKRTLRVSPGTDERAVHVLAMIARYSATSEVLSEMLRVGAVSKLCMVLQADCDNKLKKKAREILRLHNNVWNNSPCIAVYLLTRDVR